MSGPTTITINASSWARVTRERDEAREQLRIARDKCHQQRMMRLAGDKVYAEMCHEAEEQARLLAMSADREEKLRAELEEIQIKSERLHWAWQVAAGKTTND